MDMTWAEAYEQYDYVLDREGELTIHHPTYGRLTYSVSRVLFEIDPIAYRTGFNDWADDRGIDTDNLLGVAYRH